MNECYKIRSDDGAKDVGRAGFTHTFDVCWEKIKMKNAHGPILYVGI